MGTVESITKRLRSERRDVTISASISAQDSDTLDEVVEWMAAHGAPTSRAGLVRALVLDALVVFKEERAADK